MCWAAWRAGGLRACRRCTTDKEHAVRAARGYACQPPPYVGGASPAGGGTAGVGAPHYAILVAKSYGLGASAGRWARGRARYAVDPGDKTREGHRYNAQEGATC